MSQILFGAGNMVVTQLIDAYGNVPSNPTPYPLLVMQEASIDDTSAIKKLFGQNARPFAIARGETTTTLKVKAARVLANVYNAMYYGQTLTTGLLTGYNDSVGSVVPATPFQVIVSPPSTGVYTADLGVINSATGSPLKCVTGTPLTLQYAVNPATGTYTFATADVGNLYYINYQYSVSTATAGYKMTVKNLAMGAAPAFRARLTVIYQGKNFHIDARSCVCTKITFPFKNTDFAVPELDFELQDDGAGNIYDISTAE
jgi:hypothetical protein